MLHREALMHLNRINMLYLIGRTK